MCCSVWQAWLFADNLHTACPVPTKGVRIVNVLCQCFHLCGVFVCVWVVCLCRMCVYQCVHQFAALWAMVTMGIAPIKVGMEEVYGRLMAVRCDGWGVGVEGIFKWRCIPAYWNILCAHFIGGIFITMYCGCVCIWVDKWLYSEEMWGRRNDFRFYCERQKNKKNLYLYLQGPVAFQLNLLSLSLRLSNWAQNGRLASAAPRPGVCPHRSIDRPNCYLPNKNPLQSHWEITNTGDKTRSHLG